MKKLIGISLGIITIGLFVWVSLLAIRQTQDCTGHLKRATDANTVELALSELNTAIGYLEAKNLTTGYTSILYKTPNEDIGFFYTNLMNCRSELSRAISSDDQLLKSNVLMKLRETLIDNGENGDDLTIPPGLSRYPLNTMFCLFWWIVFLAWGGFVAWIIITD